MNVYDIGAEVEVRGIFTTRKLTPTETKKFKDTGELPEGVGVDPDEVTCTVIAPDDTVTHPEAKGEGGVYGALVDVTMPGVYQWGITGKGGRKAAKRGAFEGAEPLPG